MHCGTQEANFVNKRWEANNRMPLMGGRTYAADMER